MQQYNNYKIHYDSTNRACVRASVIACVRASVRGSQSGFVTLVKWKAPYAGSLHCMIHRQALASKTLPQAVKETLDSVIRTVHFVKTRIWTLFTKRFYSTHKSAGCPKAVLSDVFSRSEKKSSPLSVSKTKLISLPLEHFRTVKLSEC